MEKPLERVADRRPSLQTDRLILRPFELRDASRVQEIAGDSKIAEMTLNVPHPYLDGMAESWIKTHPEHFEKYGWVTLAITLKQSEDELIGCISLCPSTSREYPKAELGYWIGVDYWSKGYCTEAARALVKYGFEEMKLNKITSRHLTKNPASGRVMEKAGLKKEGLLRQEIWKDGEFFDLAVYGLLRQEWI